MYGIGRKGWKAHGDIFGALGLRCAVAHPFAGVRHHCLAGVHVHLAAHVLHAQRAAQNHGQLFELGCLPGLLPSARTTHMRDTDVAAAGIHPSDVFVDELGLVPRSFDPCGRWNQSGHPIG